MCSSSSRHSPRLRCTSSGSLLPTKSFSTSFRPIPSAAGPYFLASFSLNSCSTVTVRANSRYSFSAPPSNTCSGCLLHAHSIPNLADSPWSYTPRCGDPSALARFDAAGPAPASPGRSDAGATRAELARGRLEPQRYKVQFEASEEYVELVERAKALLSHATPRPDLGDLHLRAMRVLVAELEHEKYAVTTRQRVARRSAPETADAPLRRGDPEPHPDPKPHPHPEPRPPPPTPPRPPPPTPPPTPAPRPRGRRAPAGHPPPP